MYVTKAMLSSYTNIVVILSILTITLSLTSIILLVKIRKINKTTITKLDTPKVFVINYDGKNTYIYDALNYIGQPVNDEQKKVLEQYLIENKPKIGFGR